MQLKLTSSVKPPIQTKNNFLIPNETAFIAQFQQNVETLLAERNINPETIIYIRSQLSHTKAIRYYRFALIAQQLIKVFGLLDAHKANTLIFDIALALFALKILDDIVDGE
ncbi:hypothetical protein [Anabaena azotica]|uniref:hypothetical protein n=1 Tax=Anabaena azotica TaxID=197653 RepID=UPI0039A70723